MTSMVKVKVWFVIGRSEFIDRIEAAVGRAIPFLSRQVLRRILPPGREVRIPLGERTVTSEQLLGLEASLAFFRITNIEVEPVRAWIGAEVQAQETQDF